MLADSFTTYTEPGVGIAAVELLEMAGWEVELIGDRCCGRAAISKGRLDQAARLATAMTVRLAGLAREGVSIVGVEPSCILTLTEEHLALQPDNVDAKLVAGQVRLVDELILEAIDAGHLRMDPASALAGRRFLFHGHCHQKALAGTAATVGLLSRIPGSEVVELDAGCCGMAGSFGFEAEHYDLSMQIGGMDDRIDDLRADVGDRRRQHAGHQREQGEHDAERFVGGPDELERAAAVGEHAE